MNSEFQSLPPETQEAVKRTMDTMEPAQTPAEIRETLEGTQKGGVKNSIRNCLTVFQRDPLFRGALRLNLLTEQIDIVKPLGWERTSTTLTDMDKMCIRDRYNAGYTNFHSGWNIDTLCIFLDLAIGAVFWKTPFSFYF